MEGVPRTERVVRPVRASRTTTCPDCATEVGAQPEYNFSLKDMGAKPGLWRVAIHSRERIPGEPRCPGSRTFVDAMTIVEKKRLA